MQRDDIEKLEDAYSEKADESKISTCWGNKSQKKQWSYSATNYNQLHNVLDLFNVLIQTRLATSKVERDI